MAKKEKDYKEIAEQLAKENAELNEALLRERADAMNVRRRAEEDKLKLAGFYKAMVIRDLLPVIDNFERSLKHVPKDLENNEYIKGIQGVIRQFEQTLEKLGLQRIKTVGEHFDPALHEAVSAEEGDGEHEIVTEELQSGWMLGSEVLRHAMVRVRS
ncbi:nucleotide exchange factor GrpE [Candidatus Saccharibacteria bacterium]|nr:nucleotide exchange factor GrpE [Candidatus Saccharibacteria bacterium]